MPFFIKLLTTVEGIIFFIGDQAMLGFNYVEYHPCLNYYNKKRGNNKWGFTLQTKSNHIRFQLDPLLLLADAIYKETPF